MTPRRALITGHFTTFGDLESLRVVSSSLQAIGMAYDVAPHSRRARALMQDTIDPTRVDPRNYSHVLVVCGPCWPDLLRARRFDLDSFAHCVRIGVNLSMIEPLTVWNPFDFLIGRDSDQGSTPDLAFAIERPPPITVIGRCVVAKQDEYGSRQRLAESIKVIDLAISRNHCAHLDLDTRWVEPGNPVHDVGSFSALLARTDVLLTNRLHGLVLALRQGVPCVAIDGIAGGAKVLAQARAIGWPKAIAIDKADDLWIDSSLAWCTSEAGREAARACAIQAHSSLQPHLADLTSALHSEPRTPAPATITTTGKLVGLLRRSLRGRR